MVLGYGGFFGLSSTEYESKLRSAKTEGLRKQEIVKIRALVAAAWSMASGFASAYITFGGSLVVSLAGGRKWRVADRKLEMIRAELSRRGIPLRKLNWKDIAIPIGACAVGTAVGLGIDYGLGNLINVGDVVLSPSSSSSAGQAVVAFQIPHPQLFQAMIADPVAAVHGVEQGAVAQPELLLHDGIQSAAHVLGIPPSNFPVQTLTIDPSALNGRIAELGGAHLGVDGALSLEKSTGEVIIEQ